MRQVTRFPFLTIILLLGTSHLLRSQEVHDTLDRYLHPNARLEMGLSPYRPVGEEAALTGSLVIAPRIAAAFAVCRLREIGVTDIIICESHWIAAATSGYLVDALGSLAKNGQHYSVFRIGIRDDAWCERGYQAGTQFAFIALGWDSAGRPVWFPAVGPDHRWSEGEAVPEGALEYEYLLRREHFETLPARYGAVTTKKNSGERE